MWAFLIYIHDLKIRLTQFSLRFRWAKILTNQQTTTKTYLFEQYLDFLLFLRNISIRVTFHPEFVPGAVVSPLITAMPPVKTSLQ